MGRRKTVPVVGIGQFWDALMADYGVAGSYALAIEEILAQANVRTDFYDEFNRPVVDVTVWTSGGDAGSFARTDIVPNRVGWRIQTGAVIDNDRYIHGDGVVNNKRFTANEGENTTLTWEARLKISHSTNISAFWGLLRTPQTDYVEYLSSCAHFLADPVVSNTFRARSYAIAEEETDTLIALDNALHTFRMVLTAASVLFYIDDALVATHAAQVPNAPMMTEFLVRTEEAGVRTIDIDWNYVETT